MVKSPGFFALGGDMQNTEFNMSAKEVTRLEVMKDLQSGKIRQKEAGKLLNLSERQIRRMLRRYEKFGALGLVSKHRGKVSNNKFGDSVRQSRKLHGCRV